MSYIQELGIRVKKAKAEIALASSADKNRVLLAIAKKLREQVTEILEANQRDVDAARCV